MNEFRVDDAGVSDYLRGPDGPVAQFLRHAAEEIAVAARTDAPVRGPKSVWSNRTTSARRPGFTKEHIHTAFGYFPSGDIWTSANAPADPTIWLERGAKQMHHRHPFLTAALLSTPVT